MNIPGFDNHLDNYGSPGIQDDFTAEDEVLRLREIIEDVREYALRLANNTHPGDYGMAKGLAGEYLLEILDGQSS